MLSPAKRDSLTATNPIVRKLLPDCYQIVTPVTKIVIQLCYISLQDENYKGIRMKAKVLIISSLDTLTNRIASNLMQTDFDVVTCSSCVEGITRLDESPCQMVILDEGLPNCRETCHQIREIFRIPVILLANNFNDEYWQRAASIEVDAHLPKRVISSRELAACVKAILRRYSNVS